MKNAIRLFGIIALTAVIGFTFSACDDNSGGGDIDLTGNISISPNTGVTTGMELTANYTGSETVAYQWKKDGTNVGTNLNKHTPAEAGSYTVTVSATGYNSKTSTAVNVTGATLANLTGNITISPNTDVTTGMELTANYTGSETVAYQWKKDGTNVGTNLNKHTPTEAGSYTVTVSASGYNSKTSAAVTVETAQATSGLSFTLINNGTEYSVSQGNATDTIVVIPASYNGKPVTEIGYEGFLLSNMTSVIIPSSVTSIGDRAFVGCSGLTSITIPSGVTSIGNSAFNGCTGLTSITVESGNTVYRSEGNCLIQISDNSLILGCKNSVIPSSVTSIGEWAFAGCSGLTSITIPSSVTSISDRAFVGCDGLTSITIPSSVTSIGAGAFRFCSGLTSITIPSSVTSIGDDAFSYCSSLTSITIQSGVTSIGTFAFYWCESLTSITIPSSVTSIGNGMFSYCSSLTSITIPSSVTSIGSSAFYNCSALTSITIPSSVTSIGYSAFDNSGIWNNTPDNSVVYADKWVVGKKGTISGHLTLRSDTVGIGNSAFYNCSGLTSITIPSGVTSIGSWAFWGCSGLTSITIPSSVTSIGAFAFYDCSGLTTVFYGGTDSTAWNGITINQYNSNLTGATRYYYSETHPGTANTHWRWVNGEPSVWE